MKTLIYFSITCLLIFSSCSPKSEACECLKYSLDGTIGERINNYDGTYTKKWKAENEVLDAKCSEWFKNATEESKKEMEQCEDYPKFKKEMELMGEHLGMIPE